MPEIDLPRLVKAAIGTIHEVQSQIASQIHGDPIGALKRMSDPETGKLALIIDLVAEQFGGSGLLRKLGVEREQLFYLGEERLGGKDADKIDLAGEHRLVVLVDMVDGTDLVERGLSNWCSAMVFYQPAEESGKKIIAAFVGIPEDGVYYATRQTTQARKHRFHVRQGQPRDIPLPNISAQPEVGIADASICFYGQQVANLSWVTDPPNRKFLAGLKKLLNQHTQQKKKLGTRIYNLAGMPMMMKMFDSGDGLRRIDAVFDVCGQQPHDMVAGAYIARAAGAVLSDLNGAEVDLEQSLLRPAKDKLRYVLTATPRLGNELRDLFCEVANTSSSSASAGNKS